MSNQSGVTTVLTGTTVGCDSAVKVMFACAATQANITKEKQRTIGTKRKRFNSKISYY
jgi:hypothetical protein